MSYLVVLLNMISTNTQVISTSYGYGETYCGDPHDPKPCLHGAITASGEVFNPAALTAAIPMPKNQRMRPFDVYLRHPDNGPCIKIRVNDKMNERYIGKRMFDLTPGAVHAITGKKATKHWSSEGIQLCLYTNLPVQPVAQISTNFVSRSIQNIMWTVPTAMHTLFVAR